MSTLDDETSRWKPTLLVVDDEQTFRIVASEALSELGFDVAVERTATAGLLSWRSKPRDVVIVDRRLPDLDGLEVVREILRDAATRDIVTTVVVLIADIDAGAAIAGLGGVRVEYLVKPISLSQLVQTANAALERSRRLKVSEKGS